MDLNKFIASGELCRLVDHTRLVENDVPDAFAAFCLEALNAPYPVAALCVYPEYVNIVKELSHNKFPIAVVMNFPSGNTNLKMLESSFPTFHQAAIQEIDCVFPYQQYIQGERKTAIDLITAVISAFPNTLIKVIIETGAFNNFDLLYEAARDLIGIGVDFLKTSTGKIPQGATLEASAILLKSLKDFDKNQSVGFKISGGIQTPEQTLPYLEQVQSILGEEAIHSKRLRFGSSRLIKHYCKQE